MTKERSEIAQSGEGQGSAAQPVAWYTLPLAEAFQRQQTDVALGLTQAEAARRLAQHGPNTLAQARQRSTLAIFLAQFQSLIVALLVAATVIAFVMGESIEAVAILVVIVINAGIGFLTEWKAEQALSALQKQTVRLAHVIRDGAEREIPAAELVAGDLIVLAAGARVPADGRVVESARLQIEEAALTGESQAVTKSSEPLDDKDAALGDRVNMAFLGTTITAGRGRLLVTATGAQTEVGKIGILIDEATSRDTPLEQKLARLGRLLIVVVLVLCAVIAVAGWLRGVTDFWHMLEIGLSLAIAAVPEGLPAVATMTLALGMQRMARMRVLVRRLPAVETLGSTTVICTDKTGTLTRNEMTVCVYALDQRRIDVSGTGYAIEGAFQYDGKVVDPRSDEQLALALRIGALCNDAKVERTNGRETVLGDPTEAALIVAAEKAGMNQAALSHDFPRTSEVPFDPASKRMVTVHRTPQGPTVAYVKGSPGTLLAASSATKILAAGVRPLTPEDRQRWEDMGIKGTEVAKENADMVITDDNFTSIVGAVEQGRIIYGNILRFLHYLLSCNVSEIQTVFLALMFGWPLPLVALQILWLNLITDIFPAFALALEPSAPDVMKRPPRDPKESFLSLPFVGLIFWQGMLLTGVTLLAFAIGMHWHGAEGEGLRRATTMGFMTLALAQVFHAFNARSQVRSAFTTRLFTNGWLWAAVVTCLILQAAAVYLPLLQQVLQTVPPTISEWGVIFVCSLMPVAVVELVKVMQRIKARNVLP